MNNIRISVRNVTLIAVMLLALVKTSVAFAADMVPHRAFYSLKLGTVRSGSDFVGANGTMKLSMERTCEGWIISQTLRMDLSTSSGEKVLQKLRFTAWESDDDRWYRFFASNSFSGQREDFKGHALMVSPNGSGNATFSIPKGKKIALPEGTMFPLGHSAWLIERALAGDRLVSRTVFDGADGEGPKHVTAFIGTKLKAGDHISEIQAAALGPLSRKSGWKIRMGFYELDSQKSAPDYEVEILQLENGVTPTLTLDYQDFTVILTQTSLAEITLPDCQ